MRDPNRDFVKRQIKERVMNLDPEPREAGVGLIRSMLKQSLVAGEGGPLEGQLPSILRLGSGS